MDFATKVLRSLSLGTGGKMALRSEEAVVGVSVGHQGNKLVDHIRDGGGMDGRGNAAVCLDASTKRLKRSTKGSLLQPTPGESRGMFEGVRAQNCI